MMDCGKKTLIFLTLCALGGTLRFQEETYVNMLVSVPSSHFEDTLIESAFPPSSDVYQFMYKVIAVKNVTHCISTDPLCTSLVKEPKLNVSVSVRAMNGTSFNYSGSINESLRLVIPFEPEVKIIPQMADDEVDRLTVTICLLYDEETTSRRSYSAATELSRFHLDANFITTTRGNGQSALCSAPVDLSPSPGSASSFSPQVIHKGLTVRDLPRHWK